jgi:hypothetical protein
MFCTTSSSSFGLLAPIGMFFIASLSGSSPTSSRFSSAPWEPLVWGTDIPGVHQKDKRPHERLVGPIIRKVIPSWAWGRMSSEAN